jgi:hypothetical protein
VFELADNLYFSFSLVVHFSLDWSESERFLDLVVDHIFLSQTKSIEVGF